MSPAEPGKKPGGPYRKPRADVYTVLLILALISLLAGILCLYFELEMYQWQHKGGPTASVDRRGPVELAWAQGPGIRPPAGHFHPPLIPDP